jgi:hypothetical protein
VTRMKANPVKVHHNPSEWGRPLDNKYASDLGESMYEDSTTPEEGEVIMFGVKPSVAQRMSIKEMYAKGLWYLSGNHTAEGMVMVQAVEPDDKRWQEHDVLLFSTDQEQDDPVTLRFLRGESDLQNKKHKLKKDITFAEYFPKMVMEGRLKMDAGNPNDKSWLGAQLSDWSTRFGLDKKTLGLIWSTAKRRGVVAELIMQCVTGVNVVHSRKFKKATSNTYFAGMAKIDERVLERLLRKVVQGQLTLSEFGMECKMVKVEMEIRKVVLKYTDVPNWASGVGKYPTLFDDAWIATWTRTFDQVRKRAKQKRKDPSSHEDGALTKDGYPKRFMLQLEERWETARKVHLYILVV